MVICKQCLENVVVTREEVDLEAGTSCCIECGNIIDFGLIYWFSNLTREVKNRYAKAGLKVTGIKIESEKIKEKPEFNH